MTAHPPGLRLDADRVAIERGGRMVISELGFSVRGGEALLLTGPNGSGKTTLLRAIAGFVPLQEGRIAASGLDEDDALVGSHCHYVGHFNAIKPSLTVEENLASWQRFLSSRNDDAVERAMEAMALAPLAAVSASYLSAGQRRRLGLARLLAAPRPIWLLDEPTVSLDAASVQLVAEAIRGHLAGGGLAIAATHLDLKLDTASELRLGGH